MRRAPSRWTRTALGAVLAPAPLPLCEDMKAVLVRNSTIDTIARRHLATLMLLPSPPHPRRRCHRLGWMPGLPPVGAVRVSLRPRHWRWRMHCRLCMPPLPPFNPRPGMQDKLLKRCCMPSVAAQLETGRVTRLLLMQPLVRSRATMPRLPRSRRSRATAWQTHCRAFPVRYCTGATVKSPGGSGWPWSSPHPVRWLGRHS